MGNLLNDHYWIKLINDFVRDTCSYFMTLCPDDMHELA